MGSQAKSKRIPIFAIIWDSSSSSSSSAGSGAPRTSLFGKTIHARGGSGGIHRRIILPIGVDLAARAHGA